MSATSRRKPLTGLTFSEMAATLNSAGIDQKYAARVAYWIYRKQASSFDEMVNIAGTIRQSMASHFVTGFTRPSQRIESKDQSVKYIFDYPGNRTVEAVYIPEAKRNTICVSTQCGCARQCSYCRTGAMGLAGDLSAGEIVNQVLSIAEARTVTHVVFMGMGEPLDNTNEVIRAIEILTAGWGMALASANITVSTVGIIPGIEKLLAATSCNLTLSLVSPIPAERALLVPAEKTYPAATIIGMMKSAPPARKRRFTIAYMMLAGINDSDTHLNALISLIKGSALRVNLLKYHPHGDLSFQPSPSKRVDEFRSALLNEGISASIRKSRGEDISAACGMLGN
jgi:23S rRNA (adenine2503-C2)-methyltransferase